MKWFSQWEMRLLFFPFLWLSACQSSPNNAPAEEPASEQIRSYRVSLDDPHLQWWGRIDHRTPGTVRMAWTASQLVFRCEAEQIYLQGYSEAVERDPSGQPKWSVYLTVQVDEDSPRVVQLPPEESQILLADSLSPGPHTVRVFKRTEAFTGIWVMTGLDLGETGQLLDPPARSAHHLEIIGNSITCGYGNLGATRSCDFSEETEDGYRSYGALAARQVDAAYTAVCYSGKGVFRNYDGSQTGLMDVMYQRYSPLDSSESYPFDVPSPDAVAINLGTNDFAKGSPNEAEFIAAYVALCRLVKAKHPDASLILLTGSMMNGAALRTLQGYLAQVVSELEMEGLTPIYRLDLTTQGPLGYGCDWHPNLKQHQLNGRELAEFLQAELGW